MDCHRRCPRAAAAVCLRAIRAQREAECRRARLSPSRVLALACPACRFTARGCLRVQLSRPPFVTLPFLLLWSGHVARF